MTPLFILHVAVCENKGGRREEKRREERGKKRRRERKKGNFPNMEFSRKIKDNL
jgi:hypothetical protein